MKYFAAFEFRGLYDYLYWFPLSFEAPNFDLANDYVLRISTGIRQNYKMTREPNLTLIIDQWNSERISEYRAKRAVGRIQILNINQWEMRSVEVQAEVSFSEATDAQVQELIQNRSLIFSGDPTLATGQQFQRPVHIVEVGKPHGDEFLLINIVLPPTKLPS